VGEVGIGAHGIDFHAQLFKGCVVVSHVPQFGGAYEGEVSRIEEENGPLIFKIFPGHFFKLVVVECLNREILYFGVDESFHVISFFIVCIGF
jgi:hypothetical protein